MTTKKVISFDLDGTIVKPDYNEFIWFKEIPQLYSEKYNVDFAEAREIVAREYEKVGENDVRWYTLKYWLDYFGFKVEEGEVLEKYADKIEVYSEAILVLKNLHKRYSLVLASAMPRNFINVKLRKENLFQYFDEIFSAISDFNMIKKKAEFYKSACRRLGISPRNLVHIGDNYEADYLAPRKAGAVAFYLNRNGLHSLTDSFVVCDLLEFMYKLEISHLTS